MTLELTLLDTLPDIIEELDSLGYKLHRTAYGDTVECQENKISFIEHIGTMTGISGIIESTTIVIRDPILAKHMLEQFVEKGEIILPLTPKSASLTFSSPNNNVDTYRIIIDRFTSPPEIIASYKKTPREIMKVFEKYGWKRD